MINLLACLAFAYLLLRIAGVQVTLARVFAAATLVLLTRAGHSNLVLGMPQPLRVTLLVLLVTLLMNYLATWSSMSKLGLEGGARSAVIRSMAPRFSRPTCCFGFGFGVVTIQSEGSSIVRLRNDGEVRRKARRHHHWEAEPALVKAVACG